MYPVIDMLRQYKAHLWSYIEYHSGIVQLAAPNTLQKLDRLQQSYIEELHLTDIAAFLEFDFAPPRLRRDISLLGFLHKRVLGQCHIAIQRFLPFAAVSPPWHDKQLQSYLQECQYRSQLYSRSLLAVVHVYNRLPQDVIDIDSVSGFQRCLTNMARRKCIAGTSNWQRIFNTPLAYL